MKKVSKIYTVVLSTWAIASYSWLHCHIFITVVYLYLTLAAAFAAVEICSSVDKTNKQMSKKNKQTKNNTFFAAMHRKSTHVLGFYHDCEKTESEALVQGYIFMLR